MAAATGIFFNVKRHILLKVETVIIELLLGHWNDQDQIFSSYDLS